jgi:hypothetical protein
VISTEVRGLGSDVLEALARWERRRCVTRAEMDAAIAKMRAEERAKDRAIREAEIFVQPWVGNLVMTFDSASPVRYKARSRPLR